MELGIKFKKGGRGAVKIEDQNERRKEGECDVRHVLLQRRRRRRHDHAAAAETEGGGINLFVFFSFFSSSF